MSDEKNLDVQGDEEAARRLAEQRKALNLQTRPLEVIADLDWDVDDDDLPLPDAPAAAPAPVAAPAVTAPVAAAPEPSTDRLQEAVENRGGTMMMSANDFKASLGDSIVAPETTSAEPAPVAQEAVTTPVPAVTRGGTMLITGDVIEDAMAAARDAEETEVAPVTAPGGTVLMSADAVTAQLEQEAGLRSSQTAPNAAIEPPAAADEFAAAPVQTSPNPDAGSGWDAPAEVAAPSVTDTAVAPTAGGAPKGLIIGVVVVIIAAVLFFVLK